MAARALTVCLDGRRAAVWRVETGRDILEYDPHWALDGYALSRSLPLGENLRHEGPVVRRFFSNLLPDSPAIRVRLAQRAGVSAEDAFELLSIYGADCAGAVQLTPGGLSAPERIVVDLEQYLDVALSDASTGRLAPSSVAGAQEKVALTAMAGKWWLPSWDMGSTHILKLPMGLVGNRRIDLSSSVDNEWLSLAILRAYGLPVAAAEILTVGARRILAVQRFDRLPGAMRHGRVHQEDFCQTLGLPPELKYESDGGPGLAALFSVLQGSRSPEKDMFTLLAAQAIFLALAAPDGHAKNFSLQLDRQGFRLAPLYDVLSIWPVEGPGDNQFSWRRTKLAMALLGKNKHYSMRECRGRHIESTAVKAGIPSAVVDQVKGLLARTPQVLDSVAASLPQGFDGRVAEAILRKVGHHARQLLD